MEQCWFSLNVQTHQQATPGLFSYNRNICSTAEDTFYSFEITAFSFNLWSHRVTYM